jgi:hypothetical protein
MASYTLVVQSNPITGQEEAYNEWYDRQHLGDLLRIPGITAARRLALAEGYSAAHKYLSLYEIETEDPREVIAEMVRRANTPLMEVSPALDAANAVFTMYECLTPWREAEPTRD